VLLSRNIAFDFMGSIRPAARSSPSFVQEFDPPSCVGTSSLGKPVRGERRPDGSRTITHDTGFHVTRKTDDTGNTTVTVHDPAGWLVEEKVFGPAGDLVHLRSFTRAQTKTTTYAQDLTDDGWTGLKTVASEDDVHTETFWWDAEASAWIPT
jgi:hypothetical protein